VAQAIPCWGKVALARGKCGLGKVANIDWHEIGMCNYKHDDSTEIEKLENAG